MARPSPVRVPGPRGGLQRRSRSWLDRGPSVQECLGPRPSTGRSSPEHAARCVEAPVPMLGGLSRY